MKTEKEIKTKKNTVSKTFMAITCAVIVVAAILFGVALSRMNAKDNMPPAPIENSGQDENVVSPQGEDIYFTTQKLPVEGTALSEAVTLKENTGAWKNRPSYIFIAEMRKYEEQEEKQPPVLAVRDLLAVATDINLDYLDGEVNYLDSCRCIETKDFIIIIGNERYYDLAETFEDAISSGLVFSIDDLLPRVDHMHIGGAEN